MNIDVRIFADIVGRGKTTALRNWCKNQQGIGGVLSPKIEGKRYFEFIPSMEFLEMETPEATLQIGKYNFDVLNFAEAEKRIWADWINPNIHTVIIDELGPLEIKKKQGFHQLLIRILNSEISQPKKLILVVRDYCLQEFFSLYPAGHAEIISEIDLHGHDFQRPIGIVLCGGNSHRMQRDKALINYHGIPQWQYVYNMLTPFCEGVYLSLNAQQANSWDVPDGISIIQDADLYLNHGPLTGLMSVINDVGDKPIFLVACDYPLLRMGNLLHLYKRRASNKQVVCFRNNEHPEPLISIFEINAFQDLRNYFNLGKDSLAKFIRESNTHYIEVSNPAFLRNANNPEELERIKNQLNND